MTYMRIIHCGPEKNVRAYFLKKLLKTLETFSLGLWPGPPNCMPMLSCPVRRQYEHQSANQIKHANGLLTSMSQVVRSASTGCF